MTVLTIGGRSTVAAPAPKGTCIACRLVQPAQALEPVPTLPDKVRCRDEAACRERFRPRRLAWSVRGKAA